MGKALGGLGWFGWVDDGIWGNWILLICSFDFCFFGGDFAEDDALIC
jgi:hypothetical protein